MLRRKVGLIIFICSTILTVNFSINYLLSVFDLVRNLPGNLPVGGFMCVTLLRLSRVNENKKIRSNFR